MLDESQTFGGAYFMSKYNKEFKLKAVKEYLKGKDSYNSLAKKLRISESKLEIWIKKFERFGEKGLERNKVSYDGNFKLNVVEYMHEKNLSANETAIHFNLSGGNIVCKWERIYYEEGPYFLFEENRGRKKKMNNNKHNKPINKMSKEELLEENEYLRMENAYLKKLHALIQERDNPQKKKK